MDNSNKQHKIHGQSRNSTLSSIAVHLRISASLAYVGLDTRRSKKVFEPRSEQKVVEFDEQVEKTNRHRPRKAGNGLLCSR